MSKHDWAPLFDAYPDIIAGLPSEFSSHDFILRLAQQRQTDYVEALYTYRNTERQGTPAPFMIVHGVLAEQLQHLPHLVKQVGQKDSEDIFRQQNECALWRKV